jgi:5-methylcytosine-specific restriction enzyme A
MAIENFAIITENDESEWDDETGVQYHFPKRYEKYIPEGTKIIYYKGKIKDTGYSNQRLSNNPHYFGIAEIDYIKKDPKSLKGDLYAILKKYKQFDKAISNRNPSTNSYYEVIPSNLIKNYWYNAVRPITREIYDLILGSNEVILIDNNNPENQKLETEYEEGGKKVKYGTYYERNRALRNRAIEIHGLNCTICDINFEKVYGPLGKEFIHVHHIKPLAINGKCKVNPYTDLVVVCPNCHSMLHRPKNKLLTVAELKEIYNSVGIIDL